MQYHFCKRSIGCSISIFESIYICFSAKFIPRIICILGWIYFEIINKLLKESFRNGSDTQRTMKLRPD